MPAPATAEGAQPSRFVSTIRNGALPALAMVCGIAASSHFVGCARADGIGPPYDPPAGSRWSIQSEEHNGKSLAGKTSATGSTRKEDFIIVEKTAAGFRADTVTRAYEATGNQKESVAGSALFGALRDVVIHVELDKSGKPLRIANLEEVRAAIRKGLDAALEVIDDAKIKAKMHELLGAYLESATQTPETAAENFLDNLSLLATAQNTGLKLGEERRSIIDAPNPFGGESLQTPSVLRVTNADAAGDAITITETDFMDPAKMKKLALDMLKQLGMTEGKSGADAETLMREATLLTDYHTEFKVQKGMTRTVAAEANFTLSAQGLTLIKRDRTVVTVTPMQ
jgi:hypothetical protein